MRKKLPAYGGALMDLRRRGIHPLCVHLVYGFRWREPCDCMFFPSGIPGEHPLLALKPSDYALGGYDFRVVADLRVLVFDQEGEAARYENPEQGPAQPRWRRFWDLLGELAALAAEVEVQSPVFGQWRYGAHELARYWGRPFEVRPSGRGWPHWWSQSIEEKNAERRNTWLRAFLELRSEVEQLECAA